jgi:N-acetylmuramoyl-L-alanine amidase
VHNAYAIADIVKSTIKDMQKKMKSLRLTIVALATAAIAITASAAPSTFAQTTTTPPATTAPATTPPATTPPATAAPNAAATFAALETSQTPFILVAQPTSSLGGNQRYGLMIIEQKKPDPLCYSTTGSNPTQVNVLLLNFDFSGICGKSTDTNGYAIRVAGQDIAYDPVIENRNGVLVLSAVPRRSAGTNLSPFIIGQTDGIAANKFTKITMQPGWRLTRRTFNNNPTGLTYLTNDSTVAQLVALSGGVAVTPPGTPPPVTPPVTPPTAPASFPDVAGDIYANQINRAVQLGFIKGFAENNTFRPRAPITREQLVSVVIEGLKIPAATPVTSNPYPDVPASRWSATKIQQAKTLGLISGYQDGTFKPNQPVTRAELMAVINKAAQYKNQNRPVTATQAVRAFSDTQGHWSQSMVSNLSGYCGIATPLNETGSAFAPDQAAMRNYAAAAMVRLLDCAPAAAAPTTTPAPATPAPATPAP